MKTNDYCLILQHLTVKRKTSTSQFNDAYYRALVLSEDAIDGLAQFLCCEFAY